MKKLLYSVVFCILLASVFAQDAKRKPENLTMTLAWIAGLHRE